MKRPRRIEELDLDRLHEAMDYDPETGWLTWRIGGRRRVKGGRAGCVKQDGYRHITLDRQHYPASHLAWLHFYGRPPEIDVIDFVNGNRDDTSIKNLREATFTQNSQNMGAQATSTARLKGASKFYNKYNKATWRSSIRVDGKRIFLGLFHTAEEAHEAYCKAAKEMHGKFARTK